MEGVTVDVKFLYEDVERVMVPAGGIDYSIAVRLAKYESNVSVSINSLYVVDVYVLKTHLDNFYASDLMRKGMSRLLRSKSDAQAIREAIGLQDEVSHMIASGNVLDVEDFVVNRTNKTGA